MTTQRIQTQLAVRNSVGTPLGQLSHGAIIRDSPGISAGPMRVYGLYALVYLLDGGGTYQTADGSRRAVRAGDLIVVFPDVAHTYGPGAGQHWDELHVVFEGSVFDLWRQSGLLDPVRPVYHLEPIDHWFSRLRAFIDSPLPTTSVGKAQELCRFLALLTDIVAPVALASAAHPLWLSEALGLLEADLREETPLQAVAEAVGMPYETFRKQFAQQTGLSPARYRTRSRLWVAKELLVHTRMSSRQVAESLGFADEFHFSKRFKQITGQTPRQVRQAPEQRLRYNRRMKITVLGSGTSHGVPMVACECAVCTSPDPRNKRFRPSILVTAEDGGSILVDTPPELRLALIHNRVSRLDAILYTHSHADHVYGMDDIRSFNYKSGRAMPVYAEPNVLADVRRIYDYIFHPTQAGGGKPQVDLRELTPGAGLSLHELDILPLRVCHGRLPILAFKFGPKFAYVTDVSEIPAETWPHLENLDLLMLDAVRREPHETHFHFDAALEVVARLKPKRTLLTHLSHDYDHAETNAQLPPGIELAYDGQVVELM